MGFVRALFTLIIMAIVYSFFTYPIVIAIGLTLAICNLLTIFTNKLAENFYVASAYLVIASAILTLICMGVDTASIRVAIWVVANIHLISVASSFLIVFAEDIYDKKVERYSGTDDYARRYAIHMLTAPRKYAIKWLILAAPFLIVEIMLAINVKNNAVYGFINSGVYLLVSVLFYLAMRMRNIRPDVSSFEVESFSDLMKAIGNFFVKPGKEFVAFFVRLGRFFKRLFTGELFKRKPKKVKVKKEKNYKVRRKFKLPSFSFNSFAFLFVVPIIICGLTFLFCKLGWFSGGENFFADLNTKVDFVDGYGKWAKGVQEWLDPALNDTGTIGWLLAFIAILPLTLIAYVLEGIWWLISWILIGIVKLFILLIGKIIFIIPFILFGGGVALDVILFAKYDDKDTSIVVTFVISLLLCLMFGILILS